MTWRHFMAGLGLAVCLAAVGAALAEEAGSGERAKPQYKNGFAPLHFAAMRGDVKAAQRMLDAGDDIDVPQEQFKGAPLQYAAAGGHVELVDVLIKREAKVDSVDSNGRTPLIWASMQGQTEVVKALLKAGANIGAANDGGWTPLHYSMSRGHEETTAALLEAGASKQLLNKDGKTPLDVKDTAIEEGEKR